MLSASKIALGSVLLLGSAMVACGSGAGDDASGAGAAVSATDAALAACPSVTDAAKTALGGIAKVAATCSDVAPPDPGALRPFAHDLSIAASLLPAIHRGRDSFYAEGEPQWALGKFAYGPEAVLRDEEVDVWLLRGCSGTWEKLGTTKTSQPGDHETVEGVADEGARVFFRIPDAKKLDIGRHRIRMVVAGDHTVAEQFIEVLPKGMPIFVSDVDGTLTEREPGDIPLVCDEESDFPAIARALIGEISQPQLHDGASKVFQTLANDGYRPMYLTARPEYLVDHTRSFMRQSVRQDGRGDLPFGIVHTTLTLTGAVNSAAEAFKKDELQRLVAKGFKVQFGFGNRPSDVAAYTGIGVPFRFFFENLDTIWRSCTAVGQVKLLPSPFPALQQGDFRIKAYGDLQPAFGAVAGLCAAK